MQVELNTEESKTFHFIIIVVIFFLQFIQYQPVDSNGLIFDDEPQGSSRVWPNIIQIENLTGDNFSAIAIIDSGVDESHPMLYGYGDLDYSKKIIGWVDFTDNILIPYDNVSGHGTGVAAIAAGLPLNQSDQSSSLISTRSFFRNWTWFEFETEKNYLDVFASFNISQPGRISINATWTKHPQSEISMNKLTIIDPNGNYMINQTFNMQNINVRTEYEVDNDSLGIYKAAVIYNVSGNNENSYYIYSDLNLTIENANSGFVIQGVAPNVKIVVLKAEYESEFVKALEWILENGTLYNITSVNLSFKINSPTVSYLVKQLVENGFVVVAAAGNDYYGENYAGNIENSPGSVDEVLTVGAIDNRNHLASYSSQGGIANNTVKPDCLAPGGEYSSRNDDFLPIYSADSNDRDYVNGLVYPDRIKNDTKPYVGTSFSSAFTSGVVQLIVESIGGVQNWNYSKEEVLKLKSWILMTASETAPNTRNGITSANPILNRGLKDVHEGYGRINPKAVIEMLNNFLEPNTNINYSLADISSNNYYGEFCFARKVYMKTDYSYEFSLTPPPGADFDIYIFEDSPNDYGEPILYANGTKSGNTNEFIRVFPEKSGIFYITVKSVSGNGIFTLRYIEVGNSNLEFGNIFVIIVIIAISIGITLFITIYRFKLKKIEKKIKLG